MKLIEYKIKLNMYTKYSKITWPVTSVQLATFSTQYIISGTADHRGNGLDGQGVQGSTRLNNSMA